MGVGTLAWSGTATLPATGPGVVSSIAVAFAGLGATDSVVVTPSYTSSQAVLYEDGTPVTWQVKKSAGVGFTIYASKTQLPANILFDYIVMTISS